MTEPYHSIHECIDKLRQLSIASGDDFDTRGDHDPVAAGSGVAVAVRPGRGRLVHPGAILTKAGDNGTYQGTMRVKFGPTVAQFRGEAKLAYDHATVVRLMHRQCLQQSTVPRR
jgi:hypothetical protein